MLRQVLLLTYLQCGISASTDPIVVEVITGPGEDSFREEGSLALLEVCTREDMPVMYDDDDVKNGENE